MGLIKTAEQIMSGRRMPPGWVPPPRNTGGRPRTNRLCEIPACPTKHHSKGLCERHRDIQIKWGDPYHVYVRGRFGRCVCPDHPQGGIRGSRKVGG